VAVRVEHVLMHLARRIRRSGRSSRALCIWWQKVEYSRGGYASATLERRAQLRKFENRLLIGSAATAPYCEPDWPEGAVAANWQALTSLRERAMRR
jgi:monoamine oxidase